MIKLVTYKNNGIKLKISTLSTKSQSGVFGNSKYESYYVEVVNRYTKKSTMLKTRDFSIKDGIKHNTDDVVISNAILSLYEQYKNNKQLQEVVSKEWVDSMYVMVKLTS